MLMIKFIIKLLAVAVALLVAEHFVTGFSVANFWPTAVIAAIVLGLLNTVVKPVIKIFALPVTLLTLGLFSLLINVLVFWLLTFVPGIMIDSFLAAVLGLIIVTVISWIADVIVK